MKHTLRFGIPVLVLLSLFAFMQPSASLAGGETRVMVEFAPGRGAAVRTALQRAGGNIHYQFDDLDTFAVTLPEAALQGLERNPNVVSIEEDVLRYPMSTNGGQEVPWGIDAVQARDLWDANRDDLVDDGAPTGAGITVCIIDSGYYTGHSDLRSSTDVVTGEGDWSTDTCGHGTHVAGTISAMNNDLGVVGVSPDVSLFIVKVFGGSDCAWTYSSDLIAASKVCASNGADIISMSLGGTKQSTRERRQFDTLYSQGILSIAAAGNDGNTANSYPASYSSVISVAAVDESRVVADFSQQNAQVELAAPGVAVESTVPWVATTALTVDGAEYEAAHIDYAAYTDESVSGVLADGGLCNGAGVWGGQVVLCQRGDISFYDKVMNVQNSGGAAAVIYNNEPGNFLGTLGDGASSDIVAISISQEDGAYLVANKVGSTAEILSTEPVPGSGYEAWDGTSMATPHVSAVAALLWSASPGLTNVQIREAMDQTALDLGAVGRDVAYGYGLVQAYDAFIYLGGDPGGDVNTPPTADLTATCSGLACGFDASASSDTDGLITSFAWDFGDGQTATGWKVNHTYAAIGTYQVTLTVTDDDNAADSATQSVTVDDAATTLEIYVVDLTLTGASTGRNKSATAVVTIQDTEGNRVSGATVFGTWSGTHSASVSGLTGTDGTIAFKTPTYRTSSATFTFTVDDVAKDGAVYNPDLYEGALTKTVTP